MCGVHVGRQYWQWVGQVQKTNAVIQAKAESEQQSFIIWSISTCFDMTQNMFCMLNCDFFVWGGQNPHFLVDFVVVVTTVLPTMLPVIIHDVPDVMY